MNIERARNLAWHVLQPNREHHFEDDSAQYLRSHSSIVISSITENNENKFAIYHFQFEFSYIIRSLCLSFFWRLSLPSHEANTDNLLRCQMFSSERKSISRFSSIFCHKLKRYNNCTLTDHRCRRRHSNVGHKSILFGERGANAPAQTRHLNFEWFSNGVSNISKFAFNSFGSWCRMYDVGSRVRFDSYLCPCWGILVVAEWMQCARRDNYTMTSDWLGHSAPISMPSPYNCIYILLIRDIFMFKYLRIIFIFK